MYSKKVGNYPQKLTKKRIPKKEYLSWNDKLAKKMFGEEHRFSESINAKISNFLFLVSLLAIVPVIIVITNVNKNKRTEGLVLKAVCLSIFISSTWIFYGIFVAKNPIIIISSSFLIMANAYLIYSVRKVRNGEND